MEYIQDQLNEAGARADSGYDEGVEDENGTGEDCFYCHRFVHECHEGEEEEESGVEDTHQVYQVEPQEDPGKVWMEFGKK